MISRSAKEGSEIALAVFLVLQAIAAFVSFVGSAFGDYSEASPIARWQVPAVPGIYAGHYVQVGMSMGLDWLSKPAIAPRAPVDHQHLEKP